MGRKKIVWLCSWYPNRFDPFNGDFIQRHARAAALYNDIQVIHLAADNSGQTHEKQVELHVEAGLTEQVIYYRKKNTAWGRFRAHYRWLFLYKQALRNYFIRHGKPDLVHVHVPMKAGILALWLKKRYKLDFAVTEHWGIYNGVAEDRYAVRSRLFRLYTRKIFEKASAFISVSKFLGEGVNRMVVSKPFEVIPNVADTKIFYPSKSLPPVFRFIHVSNMVPLKNTEGILRAFSALQQQLPDAELVLVGDRLTGIRETASSLGLSAPAVRFRGEIPWEQVAGEMREASCLVLFSHIENAPCVIGEALCCGLPVIATHVGGIPELLNEQNSLLVEAGDETGLVAAMEQMINGYNRYDHAAIAQQAAARFSFEMVGKALDRVYEGLLKK